MEIKKRAQTKNRLLSLCLILVLLLGMFPISVTALDGAPQERVILYENIALRGEYEKHYLMSDGTSVALAFDHPVHYLLEGRWLDFDNGYDGNLRAMSLSKEQALQQAEVYLQSLGLLPNSEYIAEVSSVVKERLDQDSFEFVDAQIVSYTVTLRHASQGRLISTADSNEGIMLRFTSRGIQTLDYQWGACAPLA